VLWNYPATGNGGFQARVKIGVGWSGLAKGFVADWNSDGVFDIIAQWKDGRLSFYSGRPGGGFTAARAIGSGWGGYHVTVGRWRTTDQYPGDPRLRRGRDPGTTATAPDHCCPPRARTGIGWGSLYLTMTDFDQDGNQDLGNGGFLPEARRTVGTGWNSVNSITAVTGFTTGSTGLMTRLTDGRLAHYPFSKGTWRARTITGTGWTNYNILR
jgi:hypothetical protein